MTFIPKGTQKSHSVGQQNAPSPLGPPPNHVSLKETHNTADTSLVNVLCIVLEDVWYYQTLLLMTKHDCHCLYFYFYVFIVIINIISTIIPAPASSL